MGQGIIRGKITNSINNQPVAFANVLLLNTALGAITNEDGFYEISNIPAGLSTLQLFYFGTYLPHMGEETNAHHSHSQSKNHLWAFISCYFFGYHFEHHDSPGTPWWRLWRVKEKQGA